MMQGIRAILQHITCDPPQPPLEVGAYSLQPPGGVPTTEVLDRPSTTPISRLQSLLDPTVMVRLGFKVPSPGRVPPPLRKPSPSLTEIGKQIIGLATKFSTPVLESIHRHDKHHPFPSDLLVQVRPLVPGSHPMILDHLGQWPRWQMTLTTSTSRS